MLMIKYNNVRVAYKLVFGLLGFSAVVTEIAVLAERGVFNPVNFFSYFTVETNLIVCATLLISGLLLAAGKGARVDDLRAAATVYILIVGLGFSWLLAGLDAQLTAVPWDNTVLHYIMPIAMLADLLFDPLSRRISFTRALWWLLLPVAYGVYSLVRGALVGWYPYPFLNPAGKGYGAVFVTIALMIVLALALTWLVVKLPVKQRAKKRA